MPAAAVQPVERAQFDRCKSDKSRHAALTGPACRPQEAISQATARTEECLTSQQYTRRIASGAELYTTQSTTAETLKTAASKIGFFGLSNTHSDCASLAAAYVQRQCTTITPLSALARITQAA